MTEPAEGGFFSGEVEHVLEDEYTSFTKREPVVLTHLIGGPVLGFVALFAPGDPSSTASQVTAGVVAFALVVQGFLVRRFVAPAWKRFTGHPLPEIEAPHRPRPTKG